MADRKQNQRADDLREAAIGQDGRKNTSLKPNSTAKSTPFASRKRITTAAELSFSETLAVMDEATELPPFGFNIAILEQRLERRLGFEVTKVRYMVTSHLNFYFEFYKGDYIIPGIMPSVLICTPIHFLPHQTIHIP